MCPALAFLERLSAIVAEPAPIPRPHPAAAYLRDVGYSNVIILAVFLEFEQRGTVRDSDLVEPEDVELVEELFGGKREAPDRPPAIAGE